MDKPAELDALKKAFITIKKTKEKLSKLESALNEPIAIIGMACRFPGNADTPDKFWNNLLNGVDSISEIPSERWDVNKYYDPDPSVPGKMHTKEGGFLTESLDLFDAHFFNISKREAQSLDPQQRLLLEVSWEAIENAGIDIHSMRGSKTGVFVGLSSNDYSHAHIYSGDTTKIDAYSLTGITPSTAGGRLSYLWGFEGPCVSIDTACSSSLVSLHLACNSLRMNESDIALVGGVNLTLIPEVFIYFTKLGAISPDGRCKAFDASANGYGRGEGCGIVILKRLSDALAANDNILAVVKSSAVNQDGKSNGMTAPNGLAQQKVISEALKSASVNFDDVDYIEVHGTGTSLGDNIEANSIGEVYKSRKPGTGKIILGSVKTNIGHLEAAAGISSLIKVILCLQNQAIPKNLHYNNPNPTIPWNELPLAVPKITTSWKVQEKKRIAGISSFGFSGTNVHVIVEEAPEKVSGKNDIDRPLHILNLSARKEESIHEIAKDYIRFLGENSDSDIADICFSANTGRVHFEEFRTSIISADREGLLKGLNDFLSNSDNKNVIKSFNEKQDSKKIAFMFTGQGAQYKRMAEELFKTNSFFREKMEECDSLFYPLILKSINRIIFSESDDLLNRTEFTQPALFSIEYALAKLWESWGIKPSAVIGHSIGEFAAASISGLFSLEDAVKLVAVRGKLMQETTGKGAMYAVYSSEEKILPFLEKYTDKVSISGINGPTSIVISGEELSIQKIVEILNKEKIKSTRLVVSHAFHSPMMNIAASRFQEVCGEIKYSSLKNSFVSTVTAKMTNTEDLSDPAYWSNQIRQTVRFYDAMKTLENEGYGMFLEVGPGSTLCSLGRQSISNDQAVFLPSIRKDNGNWNQILHSLAEVYIRNIEVDWKSFDYPYWRKKVFVPNYKYQRLKYWMNPVQKNTGNNSLDQYMDGDFKHPLAGSIINSPSAEKQFINKIDLNTCTYLKDHCVMDKIIFPASAFIEIGLAIGEKICNGDRFILSEFSIDNPMIFDNEENRNIVSVLTPEQKDKFKLGVFSRSGAESDSTGSIWQSHVKTDIKLNEKIESNKINILKIKSEFKNNLTGSEFYEKLKRLGFSYGPYFRNIEEIYWSENEVWAKVTIPENIRKNSGDYNIHPGILDSCLLAPYILNLAENLNMETDSIILPAKIENIFFNEKRFSELFIHYRRTDKIEKVSETGDLSIYNESSELVAHFKGFQYREINKKVIARQEQRKPDEFIYGIEWIKNPLIKKDLSADTYHYLIYCDDVSISGSLQQLFKAKGIKSLFIHSDKKADGLNWSSYVDLKDYDSFKNIIEGFYSEESRELNNAVFFAGNRSEANDETFFENQIKLIGSLLDFTKAIVKSGKHPKLSIVNENVFHITHLDKVNSILHSPLTGFGNVISIENPELKCRMIDVDSFDTQELNAVIDEIRFVNNEKHIGLRNSIRYTPRLISIASQNHDKKSFIKIPENHEFCLDMRESGSIDNLFFRTINVGSPGPSEVKVKIFATGLNFRDVLNVLGKYPGNPGRLGMECSGVIIDCGEKISRFSTGDEVIVSGTDGLFCNYVIVNELNVLKKPANISFEDAAGLQVAFLTSYYALFNLAKLKKGESVLIHSGAGGVGIAAIKIAINAGAIVYSTAGTDEKRSYLKSLGVKLALNSRNLNFADEIIKDTNGNGIDVVLNSLNGEYIPKSLSVLKSGGRFIEIGKIGIWDEQKVKQTYPGLSYHVFDLAEVSKKDILTAKNIMTGILEKLITSELTPVPTTIFKLEDVKESFRFMAQNKHIGKIIISQSEGIRKKSIERDGLIKDKYTYLITGGFGGIGLLLSDFLVNEGARSLVLVNRSPMNKEREDIIKKYEEKGIRLKFFQADISNEEDVKHIISEISSTLPSLKGIFHTAGVLDDGMIPEQTVERIKKVFQPKVYGTWYLHKYTQQIPLDFFVLFSSAVSVFGNMGQGNYSAANAFMDSFAYYRRNKNLPALSINWGPWSEIGMASQDNIRGKRISSQGLNGIFPERGISILKESMKKNYTQSIAIDIDWPKYINNFNFIKEDNFYLNFINKYDEPEQIESGRKVNKFSIDDLKNVTPGQRYKTVMNLISELAKKIIGYDNHDQILENKPLMEQGFDSMLAVELRNRLNSMLGVTLPVSVFFDYPTLEKLSNYILKDILKINKPVEQIADAPKKNGSVESAKVVLEELENLLGK